MKKKLLLISQLLPILLVAFCFQYGTSQTNLVLNGTGDEFQNETSDNADSFDMTPNSTVKLDADAGATSASPYRALWNNSTLETYIENTYTTDPGDAFGVDEQPGSSSDGSYVDGIKTRGVKLYDDADSAPIITTSTRRLYQKVAVTPGSNYTFSIDSRSESAGVPSEVFMLNEEITTEAGLDNGAADSRVDAYLEITNDENSSKGSASTNTFTTNSFSFTASGSFVVIYVRALNAISKSTEVFYDNISLIENAGASVEDVFAANFSVYPNPANDVLNFTSENNIDQIQLIDLTGKVVIAASNLSTNSINISSISNGIYVLKITSGNITGTTKIVKQ